MMDRDLRGVLPLLALLWMAPSILPAAAAGEPPLVPEARFDAAEAESRGWAKRSFAFGEPAIDFETYAPADATVETAPLKSGTPPGALGKLTTVGKIRLAEADAPVEATITVFHLSYAAAAPRVCDWLLQEGGYGVTQRRGQGLAEAQSLGFKDQNGVRTGGAFAACFTRGERVVAVTFLFALDGDKAARNRTVTAVRGFAGGFLSNLTFADGKPSGFAADQIARLDLKLGEAVLPVAFPDAFTVRINDFRGPLPAELHLGRGVEDSTTGVLWFAAQERFGEMDFDAAGQKVADTFARTQSDAMGTPSLVSQGPAPAFDAAGIPARRYSFKVERTDNGSDGAGAIEVTMVAHRQRFYALVLWTSKSASTERAAFFSRLPGLTAYDMFAEALLKSLGSS